MGDRWPTARLPPAGGFSGPSEVLALVLNKCFCEVIVIFIKSDYRGDKGGNMGVLMSIVLWTKLCTLVARLCDHIHLIFSPAGE